MNKENNEVKEIRFVEVDVAQLLERFIYGEDVTQYYICKDNNYYNIADIEFVAKHCKIKLCGQTKLLDINKSDDSIKLYKLQA